MDEMGKRDSAKPPKPGTASALRASAERPEQPTKRVYTAEYKDRMLRELAALGEAGERGSQGAFLRREGLHWPTVHRWQIDAKKARIAALEPKKRGRKPVRDAATEEIERLRRQNETLKEKLRKAEIIIDVQKKLSALLGVDLPEPDSDEEKKS